MVRNETGLGMPDFGGITSDSDCRAAYRAARANAPPSRDFAAKSYCLPALSANGRQSASRAAHDVQPSFAACDEPPGWHWGKRQMLDCARIVSTQGQILSPAAVIAAIQPQHRLAALVGLNVLVVAASVWLEQWFFSDVTGPSLRTPRWWFALGQSAGIGFFLTSGVADRRAAIVQAIMAGMGLGYVYALVGATVVDERLAFERVDLVFQAVELGCVCGAGMAIGAATRWVGCWHLAPLESTTDTSRPQGQYTLADLLFLMTVIGMALGLFNLFLEQHARESQVWRIGATVALAVLPSLAWLWGVSQNRLSAVFALVIPLISLGLLLFLALSEFALTFGDFAAILEHAGQRTAALTFAATLNGLALRGLGFAWCRA
jgi:hypothetical protein